MSYLSHTRTKVFLYSSFTFIEYILFATVLYIIIKNARFKRIILLTSFSFILFLIIYNYEFSVKGIDSIPIGVEAILILIFSFYYLYEQMRDMSDLFIYSRYPFWIVLGMMLYMAGSFFIYIYASQLPAKEVAKYWIFTNIFSIIKNLLFTIAIIVHSKKTEKPKVKTRPMFTMN